MVLNLAKLSLLRFYYDMLDHWACRKDFQLLFCDTDSIYIAHTGRQHWDEIIQPEYRAEYDQQVNGSCHLDQVDAKEFWFPRTCCTVHKAYDKRCPGLYKVEYTGDNFIGLSSKTYVCSGGVCGQKMSSKGLQKKTLKNNAYSRFERVLTTQQSDGVQNMGFRLFNTKMYTYIQRRLGLSYYYCKRRVQADGVSTKTLDVTVNPWK